MNTKPLSYIYLKKIVLFWFFIASVPGFAQLRMLDSCNNIDGWNFIKSDKVVMQIDTVPGKIGEAIRFDYNFITGTGYGGIQKKIPLALPENYEITFWMKADSPANNFEVKLIDASGDNVWWVNNKNFTFPTKWTKMRIKKRHISFAWGPSEGKEPKRFDRIEFTVSSFVGGKGTVWIDDITFEPLPPETDTYPQPMTFSENKSKTSTDLLLDQDVETVWYSKNTKAQSITIDFKQRRELGGLVIDWVDAKRAEAFDIELSDDGKKWEKVLSVSGNLTDRSVHRMAETDTRYLRIDLKNAHHKKNFGIREIEFLMVKDGETPNNFMLFNAEKSAKGTFPRYFYKQAAYWTISGVNNDTKEALFNEDGMVEVDKATFSLEPLIQMDGKWYNWANVTTRQTMGDSENPEDYKFLPTVSWNLPDVDFKTEVTSGGEANTTSYLLVKYVFQNKANETRELNFNILVRPFQVNPYYQFLNTTGGVGKIKHLEVIDDAQLKADEKQILSQIPFDKASVYRFNQGNIAELVTDHKLTQQKQVVDNQGLAQGVMQYNLSLEPNETKDFMIKVPYHKPTEQTFSAVEGQEEFTQAVDFWNTKINHIKFNLPASANRIVNTYKSQLVYILINRDKAGIQPGSRSYERSWIRDGALTSSALLKSGIVTEVKDFINWYSGYLFDNGKVPCVVDFRGPDPVPENDSHGEYIYLLREYFNFTKDTAFLRAKNPDILKTVGYIKSLVAQRSTDYYKNGNDSIRSLYGLVPESISHEGYSAKPMHSYWDDFFVLKGLKDAVDIQHILGNKKEAVKIDSLKQAFQTNLYASIRLAMKNHHIDYIPGSAELGDFDATSTTIALTPVNELINLPKPEIYNTFNRYYDYFTKRKNNSIDWVNYTPYENRLIGSFIMLNEPERAHELIDFFLKDQRPQGWYEWAEVVWKDMRKPAFIGDMPHTWVGSDFINAIRSMFVYENEWDQSLVLASALYQDWIDAPEGMSVAHLPTYYGEISYSIQKKDNTYHFQIKGDLDLPQQGIKIQNFNQSKQPKKVTINDREIQSFTNKYIQLMQSPATVIIEY